MLKKNELKNKNPKINPKNIQYTIHFCLLSLFFALKSLKLLKKGYTKPRINKRRFYPGLNNVNTVNNTINKVNVICL